VLDTIARQFDVDKDSAKMEMLPGQGKYRIGIITFQTREGKALDLAALHAGLKATRLGKGTRSAVTYFDITARGEVTGSGKEMVLKVSGTGQQFALGDDLKAKTEKGAASPFQQLRAALAKGKKVTTVTGRLQGWSGVWPEVLKTLPGEPIPDPKNPNKPAARRPLLMVTDFQIAKEKK
jgi:hypothetical protein